MSDLTWLMIRLRWLGILIITPLIYLFGVRMSLFYSLVCVYVLAVITALLAVANGAFSLWHRWSNDHRRQLMVQLVLDMFAISILLHYTGGLTNPLYVLFVVHLIIAAKAFNRLQTLAVTTFASALVVVFGAGEFYGQMMHHSLNLGTDHPTLRLTKVMIHNPYYVTARVLSLVVLFYATALLTRYPEGES